MAKERPGRMARAHLSVRTDEDFVAVPLSRSELELLVRLWQHADEIDHEALSIQLKALGGLALLERTTDV